MRLSALARAVLAALAAKAVRAQVLAQADKAAAVAAAAAMAASMPRTGIMLLQMEKEGSIWSFRVMRSKMVRRGSVR